MAFEDADLEFKIENIKMKYRFYDLNFVMSMQFWNFEILT